MLIILKMLKYLIYNWNKNKVQNSINNGEGLIGHELIEWSSNDVIDIVKQLALLFVLTIMNQVLNSCIINCPSTYKIIIKIHINISTKYKYKYIRIYMNALPRISRGISYSNKHGFGCKSWLLFFFWIIYLFWYIFEFLL